MAARWVILPYKFKRSNTNTTRAAFVSTAHTIAIMSILFCLYSNLVSGRLWWDESFYVVAAAFNLVLGCLFLTRKWLLDEDEAK